MWHYLTAVDVVIIVAEFFFIMTSMMDADG